MKINSFERETKKRLKIFENKYENQNLKKKKKKKKKKKEKK